EGLDKFIDIMVALKDNLEIKTLHGILEHSLEQQEKEKPPKHFVEKITNSAAEATRDNIAYLKQAVGRPITDALKGLCGRSEEHTSELQSRFDLVCRLLLEKKNTKD